MTPEEKKARSREISRNYMRRRKAKETPEEREARLASGRAYYQLHKERLRAKAKQWHRDNPEKAREYYAKRYMESREQCRNRALERKFGITRAEYDQMLADQGGVCKLCDGKEPYPGSRALCVDHDHETGKVRSLLCTHCNSGLGMFRDSPDLLRAAAAYIEAHKK
jgi:hypothetical protein